MRCRSLRGTPVLVALRYQAGSRKRGNQMNVPSSAMAPVRRRTRPISPFTHEGSEYPTPATPAQSRQIPVNGKVRAPEARPV